MTIRQDLINKINAKQNFTHNLTLNKSRYVVSLKSIYKGFNPSIQFDLIEQIYSILGKKNQSFDSLGGWYNETTKVYCLDLNLHLSDLSTSLKLAKVNKQLAIYDSKKQLVIYLNS
tara:strand:- start:645 stop:992 length:348 start_codon:yes stop_codon:yes gene_type:complete